MKLKQIPHALKCVAKAYAARKCFAKRDSRELRINKAASHLPVLSITSIGPRLETLHLALHHILRNGPELAAVEIWLDHSLQNKITEELKWLVHCGCTLNFVDDLGPHTKLIYCLQKHPYSSIITVDDDILLPERSLEILIATAEKYPATVICNRARRILLDPEGRPLTYSAWKVMNHASTEPETGIMALGYGGILYPKGSLDAQFADHALFKKLCPTGDDLWFMAMRLIQGTKVFHSGHLSGTEVAIPGSGKHCIKNRHEQVRGNNDESIQRLFEALDLTRYLMNEVKSA